MAVVLANKGARAEAELCWVRAVEMQRRLTLTHASDPGYRRDFMAYSGNLAACLAPLFEANLAAQQIADAASRAGRLGTLPDPSTRLTAATWLVRCAGAAARDHWLSDTQRQELCAACVEQAVELLQRLDREGVRFNAAALRRQVVWEPLREHPGFRALLAKLGAKSAP